MAIALTGKQRRHLRGLGHSLRPVVHIGKQGLAAVVVAEIESQLLQHELIKVKVLEPCPLDRDECAHAIVAATACALAQQVGRTLLLYRPHPEEPQIELPAARSTEALNVG